MRSNVSKQQQDGYCHVTVRLPLGDFTCGPDARAGRPGRGLRRRHDAADGRAERALSLGEERTPSQPFYERLAAAGLGAPDAGTLERRRQLPRGGELPACRDAVARPRPRADRVPERATRAGGHGAVRHTSRSAAARTDAASITSRRSDSRAACARSPAAPCRSTSCWSAAAAPTKASRISARSCRRCPCTA